MRSSIIQCCMAAAHLSLTATMTGGAMSRSTGKKSKFLCLLYFLMIINSCTSSFYGDKNNFNKNHFTTHHPLRHHRHHALNRTHTNYHHRETAETFTTRSPIESVRNFLSSREYDTNRNYYHMSSTKTTPLPTKRPSLTAHKSTDNKSVTIKSSYDQKYPNHSITRNHRNIQTNNYQKAKEKTFDDIIREISQFKKRKRFHKTTTTTTTTTAPTPEEDYDEYDDDDFQDDEGGYISNHDNGFLSPERQTSSEKYIPSKKVNVLISIKFV